MNSWIMICSTVRETNNFLPCFSMQWGIFSARLVWFWGNQTNLEDQSQNIKQNVAICQGGIPNLSCLFEAVQVLCFFADPDVVYPREDTKKYVWPILTGQSRFDNLFLVAFTFFQQLNFDPRWTRVCVLTQDWPGDTKTDESEVHVLIGGTGVWKVRWEKLSEYEIQGTTGLTATVLSGQNYLATHFLVIG